MKILHIITRLIVGGAQENTILCVKDQVQRGYEVSLAFGPIYGPEGSLREQAQATDAKLYEVASLRRAVLPIHDYLAHRSLRNLIRQMKPDVVHTHSSKAGIVGRSAAFSENVPVIIHTIHGLPFTPRQNPLVYKAYVIAERWAAGRCHHLVGITQAMCDAFTAERIGTPAQFSVIPSGVDIQAITPPTEARSQTRQKLGIGQGPVIGIVARLDPLKRQEDLISIFPDILKHYPDAKLLIVGDGWHRQAIEAQIHTLGIGRQVILTGLVSKPQVMAYLAAMDVMALPSYQEGQGRTLVEALAASCAIVGYQAGGIGEVCIDGVTGKLGPIGDRQKLKANILELLDHPSHRNKLIENGRRHIMQHFDIQVMTSRLDSLYHHALQATIKR